MNTILKIFTCICFCVYSQMGMAQMLPPKVIDQGISTISGSLVEGPEGQLTDFKFQGMEFSRTTEPIAPAPASDYRAEVVVSDGTILSSYITKDRTSAPTYQTPPGESRIGGWEASFQNLKDAKELRILFQDQVLYSITFPNTTIPYFPVLTQIDKNKVRIDPTQVEMAEFTLDDGLNIYSVMKKQKFPNGILTLPIPSKPGQRVIVMVDVIVGLTRHTTWAILDPNFVPPPTQ